MREFFNGWRRKVGVATLVWACVFAAAWVRSFSIRDFIPLPKLRTAALATESGCLVLLRETEAVLISEVPGLDVIWENVDGIENPMNPMPPVATMVASAYFEKAGSIPYWSLVLPLTLLSGWLLLSKPRLATPMKPSEPALGEAP